MNLGKLLILDDDEILLRRLSKSMESFGFEVTAVSSIEEAEEIIEKIIFDTAVLDLKLADGSGLSIVKKLSSSNPKCRAIMLTGFGNIATAVAAMKVGAIDYLPKPASAEQIKNALVDYDKPLPPPPDDPMSADRVRWEHIQRIFEQCNRNVSETARRLKNASSHIATHSSKTCSKKLERSKQRDFIFFLDKKINKVLFYVYKVLIVFRNKFFNS